MLIDIIDYMEKVKETGKPISQTLLSKISGVNRYTINMAINDHDGIYNMPPDKVYKIYEAHPDALIIPEDFYVYSTASFLATSWIEGTTVTKVAKQIGRHPNTIQRIVKGSKAFFIYDNKDIFESFDYIYIPVFKDKYAVVKDIEVTSEDMARIIEDGIKKEIPRKKISKEDLIVTAVMHGCSKQTFKDAEKQISRECLSAYKKLTDDEKSRLIAGAFPSRYTYFVTEK